MSFALLCNTTNRLLSGWITDATGNYDTAFYIMGAIIALSGLMLFFIPCVRSYVEKRQCITQHDVDMGRKVADETMISTQDLHRINGITKSAKQCCLNYKP